MTRVLAYCAFQQSAGISVLPSGVGRAPVEVITEGELGLLWSEVEWPFADSSLQRNAVEFHDVVVHMFSQVGVIPFRLLSIFEDRATLANFLAAHQSAFLADLDRLENLVQMECVLYFAPEHGIRTSGRDYLERKAELLRKAEKFVESMTQALGAMNQGIRARESKNGSRIFVLVARGNENKFHSIVRELPVPERLARRTSGPWPAAEFLSDSVKTPQIAR